MRIQHFLSYETCGLETLGVLATGEIGETAETLMDSSGVYEDFCCCCCCCALRFRALLEGTLLLIKGSSCRNNLTGRPGVSLGYLSFVGGCLLLFVGGGEFSLS